MADVSVAAVVSDDQSGASEAFGAGRAREDRARIPERFWRIPIDKEDSLIGEPMRGRGPHKREVLPGFECVTAHRVNARTLRGLAAPSVRRNARMSPFAFRRVRFH